jgi:hypothetical protein
MWMWINTHSFGTLEIFDFFAGVLNCIHCTESDK